MAISIGSVNGLLTAKTGVGGLVSGMDIDELILKMTTASRKRITQQEQAVQRLLWKQDAYRSVTKSLMEFRDKYLNVLSATNFKSAGLFNTVKATLPEGITAFTATATGSATIGNAYVNQIQQLASSYSLSSGVSVSKPLTGNALEVSTLADLATVTPGDGMPGILINVDGQSRALVLDSQFVTDLGAEATLDLATASASERATAFAKLEEVLQKKVNALFENPSSIDPYGNVDNPLVKVSVDSDTGAISFSSDRATRITVNYLSEPIPKTLKREDFATDEDFINAKEQEKIDVVKRNALTKLGFENGQTNKLNTAKSLDDLVKSLDADVQTPSPGQPYRFYINGHFFEINSGESVNSFMSKINSSAAGVTLNYSEVTDKFTMTSNETGAGVAIQINEFGGTNLFEALGLDINTTDPSLKPTESFGSNAIAYINGNYIERSTNDFIVDGVRYSLKELYNAAEGFDPFDPLFTPPAANSGIQIKLATDTDDLFNTIKQFVEDYNAMITNIRGLTKEKVYSDYEPLTDEQRAQMTEGQIKLWEEKAKSGILASDNLLLNIANNLQSALLSTVSDGFGFYSMGIQSAGYTENGKLVLNEEKLREALNSHGDEVRNLFVNATNGISTKLDKIIDDAVRTNGVKGTRGSLIEMAGYEATRSDLDNGLRLQIDSYNKRIDSFKDLLKKEEERLWSQFSAMEAALSRMYEQSSILSQYLGVNIQQ